MKILLVNKYLRPVGGSETVVFQLWEGLEARGHTVIPFGLRHVENRPSPWQAYWPPEVTYEAGLAGRTPWNQRLAQAMNILHSTVAEQSMEALLAQVQPDVAHVHNIYHQLSPSILRPLARRGIPILMTVHDYKLVCPNYKLFTGGQVCTRCVGGNLWPAVQHRCVKDSRLASFVCLVEGYAHRLVNAYAPIRLYLAPSRFLATQLMAGGLPRERVWHWPNAVALSHRDASQYSTVSFQTQSHQSGTGIEPFYLYAGRLGEEKGVWTLVRAAMLAPQVPVWLAGDGPLRAEIESFCQQHGLKHIRLLGRLDRPALEAHFHQALAVVVPSHVPENCSLSVLEAMAHARPVLGAKVGGLPELIIDGQTGWLHQPQDVPGLAAHLSRLAAQPAEAQRLGAAGRARVQAQFSLEDWLDGTEALYEELRNRGTEELRELGD